MASDSDDDWFDKDISDFTVEARVEPKVEFISFGGENQKQNADADYGGNYNQPITTSTTTPKGSTAKSIQPISLKRTKAYLGESPINIFLKLIQDQSGFRESLFRSNTSTDSVLIALETITKILTLPLTECKKDLLQQFVEYKAFWIDVEKCLNLTIGGNEPKIGKKKNNNIVFNHKELWDNVVILCENIAKHLLRIDKKFFEIVRNIVKKSDDKLKLHNYTEVFNKIEQNLNNQITFKEIYPTIGELIENPVSEELLKPNITKGQYSSVKEYLDVHLTLLREDFLSPIRDGIGQLKKDFECNEPKSNGNIQFYGKVHILSKQKANTRSHRGECLMIDLDPDARDQNDLTQMDKNLISSKKLMFGSLLLLTQNENFDNLILAVVANRDHDLLAQYYVQIEIIKMYNITSLFGRDFMMLESEVYFEPYHQVYKVLSKFTEDNFPLRNYIIDINHTHEYPDYFPKSGRMVYTYKQSTLDTKYPHKWPDAQTLQINDSQWDAMKNSLTHKFSLIHGPPGTGKSFVGLEIVSILLQNTQEQIVILCNTNQALDNLLMGISSLTSRIVRVGQQSKNEQLDAFNIKELTEKTGYDKRIKSYIYKTKLEYVEMMGMLEDYQNQFDNENHNRAEIEMNIFKIQEQLRTITRRQDELRQLSDYLIVNTTRVIGMTSTWAARSNTFLQLLKPSIFIIEEASEMLESHIIAALNTYTKHVILLGDHQQLRPITSVYKLAKTYKMDISLFERMINNGLNCQLLNVQHRMRPEIANLLRPMIYADLLDHDTVLQYPNVTGVKKNLFFLNHTNPESNDALETSKKNPFEAQFLCAFCNYLIKQGHEPATITILTTYNGQLAKFAQERRKYPNLHTVRIAVVDNFQGEENKIILLSLVRSNTKKNIGYLAMKNRISVALSRAQEGLYMIGNMNLLAENSTLWARIKQYLEDINAIGNELVLECSIHGHEKEVATAKDLTAVMHCGC